MAANCLGKVIDSVLVWIEGELNYLWCFDSNVQCLMDEAERLNNTRVELQSRVDAVRNNGQVIALSVNTWLSDAAQILEFNNELEGEYRKVGCFSVVSRYSLSKKAKKAKEEMEGLLGDNFSDDRIGEPRPAASMSQARFSSPGVMEFVTRKEIQDAIFRALQDNKYKKIGICGMGGVGKTTMANQIMDRAREENLFKEIIMVVLSQSFDTFKIQEEMGEKLGFKDLEEFKSLSTRANALRDRLRTYHALIVLDDIWEKFELEDIGIPRESGSQGCTVLFTSRNRDVLKEMDAESFGVEFLPEEEAWLLFKGKIGDCVDDQLLDSVGKDIVNECKGLPLAIVIVGAALKDKKEPIWLYFRCQLQSPTHPASRIEKEVYKPLRLSYDNLEELDAKVLFLLCCLFPDDYNISLDDLTTYMVGLEVFKGIRSLTDMRNRVFAQVDILKSRSLLLDGEKECVKMHDVIRDVARCIASGEGKFVDSGRSDQEWISIFDDSSILGSNYTSLHLLLVHAQPKAEKLPSWEEMRCLNVLSIKSLRSKKLTQVFEHSVLPKSLRTLEFLECDYIGDITSVGKLTNLEILRCVQCKRIEQFPIEIGNLKLLKLLDITDCKNLKTMAPGVISNLVALEELKMRGSFNQWESRNVNGEKRENASLIELESLHELRWLEIDIKDGGLLAEEMQLSKHIVKYDVCVGKSNWLFKKARKKDIKITTEFGNQEGWFRKFLSNAEFLYLGGRSLKLDLSTLDLSQVQNCRSMEIYNCRIMNVVKKEMVYLFQMSRNAFLHVEDISLKKLDDIQGVFFNEERNNHLIFPKLEKLQLSDMPNLTTFCQGFESIEFPLLRNLTIESCPKLKNIISSTNLTGCKHFFCNEKVIFNQLVGLTILKCNNIRSLFTVSISRKLVHLQELTVKLCDQMEIIIGNEEEIMEGKFWDVEELRSKNTTQLTFAKLEKLEFWSMPSLKMFCEGVESIDFPVLKELIIEDCPKFVNILHCEENHQNMGALHLFCHEKVILNQLVRLTIWNCNNIRSVHLQYLSVQFCDQMEIIIGNEDEVMEEIFSNVIFSKLEELQLGFMLNLKMFCKGVESIDFPVLQKIDISHCYKFVNILHCQENHQNMGALHLFCHEKVTFKGLTDINICGYGGDIIDIWCQSIPPNFFEGLRSLTIEHCDTIRRLFSSTIVRHLVNLEFLDIEDCSEMEKVITEDEEMVDEMFPSLQSLYLTYLPKLRVFYETKSTLKLPLLKSFVISDCHQMEYITSGFLEAPKLEAITPDPRSKTKYIKKKGWNETAHYIYKKEAVFRIREAFEIATNIFFNEEGFLQIDKYKEYKKEESCVIVEQGEAVASLFKSIQPIQSIKKEMMGLIKELNDDIEKLKETNNLGQIIPINSWEWNKLNSQQFISLSNYDQRFVVSDICNALDDKKEYPSQTVFDSIVLAVKDKANLLFTLHNYTGETENQINTVVTELNETMVKLEEDYAKDFFVSQAFLSLSTKLNDERSTRVYTLWPSNNHLGMVKAEVAFVDIHDVMYGVEAYVKYVCKWLLENRYSPKELMKKIGDGKASERLQALVESEFCQITYTNAIHVLKEAFSDGKIENAVEWGTDLSLEHQRYLVEEKFNSPVFIYDYPKTRKSFYMKVNDDHKTVASMELLLPKVGKLVSGSQIEENSEVFKNNLREAGLSIDAYDWYLEIMPYKNIQHAEFTLLFEQLFLFITGMNNTELSEILQHIKDEDEE